MICPWSDISPTRSRSCISARSSKWRHEMISTRVRATRIRRRSSRLRPVPDPRSKSRPKIELTGEVPSPLSPPSGCRFHTRCWKVTDLCRTVEPKLEASASGHSLRVTFLKPTEAADGMPGRAAGQAVKVISPRASSRVRETFAPDDHERIHHARRLVLEECDTRLADFEDVAVRNDGERRRVAVQPPSGLGARDPYLGELFQSRRDRCTEDRAPRSGRGRGPLRRPWRGRRIR